MIKHNIFKEIGYRIKGYNYAADILKQPLVDYYSDKIQPENLRNRFPQWKDEIIMRGCVAKRLELTKELIAEQRDSV